MIRRIILVSALSLAATPSAKAADFADDLISLTFSSKSISNSVTEGGNPRGPHPSFTNHQVIAEEKREK